MLQPSPVLGVRVALSPLVRAALVLAARARAVPQVCALPLLAAHAPLLLALRGQVVPRPRWHPALWRTPYNVIVENALTASAPCHRSSRISLVIFSDLSNMRTYLSRSAFVCCSCTATNCDKDEPDERV